ncbi:MAG: sigma 54-interacting transcriptional regulator [Vicinamibacterales bacterium]
MISAPTTARTAILLAEADAVQDLEVLLLGMGYLPFPLDGADAVLSVREPVALCLLDLRQNGEALRTARVVKARHPRAVLIGVADPDRPTTSADALRAGVFDVLPRPASARDLEALIANALELSTHAAQSVHTAEASRYGIAGTSPAMAMVLDIVQRAAAGRCGILICGERGSGREMVARAVHSHDPNPQAPFIKIDCSNPSPEDIELELFGVLSKRTAAPEGRALERVGSECSLRNAQGGILFLENALELPARTQARLVRVLRDREVSVAGIPEPQTVDFRPIASVDGSIDSALEEGRIRADLFERLSLVRIDVPALRQRREDIPVLALYFLKDLCRIHEIPLKTLTRPAITLLQALPWRGNAPELRSLLERLVLLVPNGLIRIEDVVAHTQLEGSISPAGFDATLRHARARFERDYIAAVLQHQHGRIPEAAKVLGIQRTNLYRKMRRLNLMHGKARRDS